MNPDVFQNIIFYVPLKKVIQVRNDMRICLKWVKWCNLSQCFYFLIRLSCVFMFVYLFQWVLLTGALVFGLEWLHLWFCWCLWLSHCTSQEKTSEVLYKCQDLVIYSVFIKYWHEQAKHMAMYIYFHISTTMDDSVLIGQDMLQVLLKRLFDPGMYHWYFVKYCCYDV